MHESYIRELRGNSNEESVYSIYWKYRKNEEAFKQNYDVNIENIHIWTMVNMFCCCFVYIVLL